MIIKPEEGLLGWAKTDITRFPYAITFNPVLLVAI